MSKKIIQVLLAAGLLVVVAAGGYLIFGPSALERRGDRQIELAKKAVAAELLDGESARFRNVRLEPPFNGMAVCGEVNGKNRYGAYVGFNRFIVIGREPTSARIFDDEAYRKDYNKEYYKETCNEN
jgi:hypothetical protein